MALPDGAVQVFAEFTRFTNLDPNGFVAPGASVYTTDQLIKATFTPNVETGVDLTQTNANGDLIAHYKHGDMMKYWEVSIQMATNDPIATAMLIGGTVFTASGTALGAPTGATATAQTTLGHLSAGVYGYLVTQYNQYGETTPQAEVTATVASGTTGTVVVTAPTLAAGAVGWAVYGRQSGGEQFLGQVIGVGSEATSAASGTGAVAALTVTALTDPIPEGFTFQITGDTNSVKIVFTTTEAAGAGATSLAVSVSQTVTTTIAAAAIVPVFVDTGLLKPFGRPPTSDSTAGPGSDVGFQSPRLGIVGNPYGVSIEMWARETLDGTEVSYLPFNRWVFPGVKNLRDDARPFGPEMQLPTYLGQAFENPNWGSGPFNDWQFDSTAVYQNARAGANTAPVVGLATTQAIG